MRRLAVGGMAEVFLAEVRGEGGFRKFVAIKRILPHLSSEKEFISMFFDEARLMARFAHPNIVQIYDLGRVGKSYFLAMEFVKGLTMFRVVNRCAKLRQRVPLDIACRIVSDTCSALDYAHNFTGPDGSPLEIVHRDVSAQNIMLSTDGVVKVLDFGVAKAVGNLSRTRPSWLKGKALYMSPEQIEMRPIDRRSDIFSLGTLLYIMTTMHRPFRGESEYQVMMSIVNQPAPNPRQYNRDLPAEIMRIVNRALQKDPAARYQTAAEMREDLEHYLFERRRRVEASDLSEFLYSLLPGRKKKTSSMRRVPTRPIPAPAPGIAAIDLGGMERDEVSADQPLLLIPKTKAEPIVLDRPKTPIREVTAGGAPSPRNTAPATPRRGVALARVAATSSPAASAPAPLQQVSGEQPFSALADRSHSPLFIALFALLAVAMVVLGVWFGLSRESAESPPADSGVVSQAGAFERPEVRAEPASPVNTTAGMPSPTVESAEPKTGNPADAGTAGKPVVARHRPKRRPSAGRRPPQVSWKKQRSRVEPEIEKEQEPAEPARVEPSSAAEKSPAATSASNSDRQVVEQPQAAVAAVAGKPSPSAPTILQTANGKSVTGNASPPSSGSPVIPASTGKVTMAAVKPEPASTTQAPAASASKVAATTTGTRLIFQVAARVKARRVSGREPEYPRIARQARLQATLVVKIFISPKGRIERVRFLKTHEAFEGAVRKALETWRFSPYLVGGRPVATYTVYKFVFKLD